MKKTLLLLGAFVGLTTAVAASEVTGSVGLGAGIMKSPYQGVGTEAQPLPIFNVEWNDFYLKSADVRYSMFSLGYNFYKTDSLVLSAYANPYGGFNVDRADMDDGYNNIDKRKYQFEGGLKGVYSTPWNGVKISGHITGGEEGGHTGISVFRPYRINEKMTLIPRVGFTYFNEDYTDYYFGIDQGEVDRNSKIDKTYSPDGAYSVSADLAMTYAYNERTTIVTFAGIEKLSSEIDDSPIVEEDVIYRVGVTAAYKF